MSNKITLQDIIDLLAEKHHMTKKDAETFVRGMFELIEEALATEKYVKVKGLGTFKLTEVGSRGSVDVKTGERFEIQGHTKISFTPDSTMRDLINKPFAHFETVVLNENTRLEDTETEIEGEEEEEENTEDVTTEIIEESVIAEKSLTEDMEETEVAQEEKEDLVAIEPIATVKKEIIPTLEEESIAPTEDTKEVPQTTGPEEEILSALEEEKVIPAPLLEETVPVAEVETTLLPMEEAKKTKTPWGIIAAIFLILCIAGGLYWYLQHNDTDPIPQTPPEEATAPQIQSEKEENNNPTLLSDSLTQQKDTANALPEELPKKTTTSQGQTSPSTSSAKASGNKDIAKVNLADTVEYDITGTKTNYTLQEGESLIKVAMKFYGTKKLWPYIVRHNKDIIKNADRVPIGTTLRIPELAPKKQ